MSEQASEYAVVLTTAGSSEQARGLARELVDRRLAACVSILEEACSIFRWKGEVSEEREYVLLIKTRAALYPDLQDAIGELHSYECPEIVMLSITDGEPRYLGWLSDETRP